MTKKLCFTVDVDRDVNERVPGRIEAVSVNGISPRFSSSEKGTKILLDMLNDIGIKATFFTEAATLRNIDISFGKNEVAMHGTDHEDMTGEVSGIRLTDEKLKEIMRTSAETVKEITGTMPKGFRAPYMKADARILKAAAEAGAEYDSSMYATITKTFVPFTLENGMKEIPVPESRDGSGKRITGYLWPMHEGSRTCDDFIKMADAVEEGVLVIATHSWHMTESKAKGMMDPTQMKRNADLVRKIIVSVMDKGFKASRMADAV